MRAMAAVICSTRNASGVCNSISVLCPMMPSSASPCRRWKRRTAPTTGSPYRRSVSAAAALLRSPRALRRARSAPTDASESPGRTGRVAGVGNAGIVLSAASAR